MAGNHRKPARVFHNKFENSINIPRAFWREAGVPFLEVRVAKECQKEKGVGYLGYSNNDMIG